MAKRISARRAPARNSAKSNPAKSKSTTSAVRPRLLFIHGLGAQPPHDELRRQWDLALCGREMGIDSRMAYWSDLRRGDKTPLRTKSADRNGHLNIDALLEQAGVSADNDDAQFLARSLARTTGVEGASVQRKVLPLLPGFLRRPIARAFLEALIKDTAAYFFRPEIRRKIQQRLRDALPAPGEILTIVAHSQGSIITLEVLAELSASSRSGQFPYIHLITIGSPLGIREVQDFLSCKLEVPAVVEAWHNFADPLDPVALDKGIGNDFAQPRARIIDELIMNTRIRRLEGFNPHSAVGYLAHPRVREVAHHSARLDAHRRFLVARDVANDLAIESRQPVLIEILEPGYRALDEELDAMRTHERDSEKGRTDLASRIEHAAQKIEQLVGKQKEAACVDRLRRFVAARLTPAEVGMVAHEHRDLRVYAVWKNSTKRKLLNRSLRVIQADAARASYGALGQEIRWAVLDTGVRRDHPHFKGDTIEAVWDCTRRGAPVRIDDDKDKDGHGTHVAGIIAGFDPKGNYQGIAPKAKLIVYKVLNDAGSGEDAWIIKALDHIAELNENNAAGVYIHGLNLSLGGPYDATVYGCGFTPICVELRRLWRAGVLVVIASGNEGQIDVNTPDGELEINSPMSIGDPANLEDCIAVGSVNADSPHLYGISSFSSRGPTSDGRVKPDVVAPGERICSCNSRYRNLEKRELYRQESGTSMAAPHVSGLLAAFLSVRREFRGRPDEVKDILLRTCTDLRRDRYHQGHGIPNLMRMLLGSLIAVTEAFAL